MNKIDAHVKHYGKGKTRETRCAHCDRLFASRSKDRWRQHMRGCSRVPLEDRQYFTNIERRAFGRPRLSLTASEAASEHLQSPMKNHEPEEEELEETEPTEVGTTLGGEVSKADLLSEVQTLAAEAEVSLSTHESNHEGTILDWLLNARENEIIVLCWVGPLSDSPMIVRALELVKNPVIVVSTKGVEHGALPSTVVGVMSGFGLQSIELALIAAKNISSTQQ
ncbi:hypothetical protein BBO99_00002528 [Phytophthora kernoviae]|uniref:3-dehydroquinate dehydratase n=2 Tax=Phytophthora kernoviae TaxID=325452 RepID=A0A3R7H0F5_9STRA|nr:hypothetical protein G195_002904 [Phytophthora kernoviae 00238/432]KAG2524492.1 hypothetical protein JM16_004900 [Phytophthora kernoviae]KAG2530625.1 hypothetical protein JM18_002064 [Phytophthora kernoviae]RLN36781.1 hypothetical protein BBI17_002380 [Phytophthora kernoviae]RLN82975.1 hypothetical protein BBO99_00002528 [Phytophthora kernoviae]